MRPAIAGLRGVRQWNWIIIVISPSNSFYPLISYFVFRSILWIFVLQLIFSSLTSFLWCSCFMDNLHCSNSPPFALPAHIDKLFYLVTCIDCIFNSFCIILFILLSTRVFCTIFLRNILFMLSKSFFLVFVHISDQYVRNDVNIFLLVSVFLFLSKIHSWYYCRVFPLLSVIVLISCTYCL